MQRVASMMNAENLDASPILALGEIGQANPDAASDSAH